MSDAVRVGGWVGDVVSALVVVGSIAGVIPWFTALFGLVYYAIHIYETKTVQEWLGRRRQ